MWYEILPSYAIMTVAMAIPGYAMYFMNKAVLGNPYKREMRYRWDRHLYMRDGRLTDGRPYEAPGLEAIPD
ncbi:NADH dehydrogenase [ubiquinone] 1 alpha subcomplex subunit 1 [Neodiprion pinetum]|uniref:NADH dehydrogenase [ubiquinone] 1 alpha subcomplex subunit 1 n=1 Tax=Neodiprion lecontei TaxID=441921 RepID=A0A6J0B9A1_NEOLC|nr:uncharacterized protein LOC107218239 [Neodiprion lecontei]XP_046411870.1 uncharacterized protein LOC124175545 [Neodiprion fabricii]XP_046469826.1 uncharacterized protein LOC124213053 [Neodiprion pinetum]XP_046605444.1 uncharacterized protein LOC124297989 [Neodiprion virginianus]